MIKFSISFFVLFLVSCTDYTCDEIIYKDGLRYEKATGNLANGHYKCLEIRTSSEHITEQNFKQGLGFGKWTYHAQGQLIHSGEYLNCPDLVDSIKSKTDAAFIEVNAWYEGSYGELNVVIISQKISLDSLSSLAIVKSQASKICSEYGLQQVKINQRLNDEWTSRSFDID